MATILIVEEEPNVQMLYSEGLEDEGHNVVPVDNYEDACRMMERSAFDLVIVNLGLANPAAPEYLEKFLDFGCDLMILAYVSGPPEDTQEAAGLSLSPAMSELKSSIRGIVNDR